MKYTISYRNTSTQFIHIRIDFDFGDNPDRYIQLPIWRPGRYERGDFAQYIVDFTATDVSGNKLPWQKQNSALWQILTDEKQINVSYKFYAAQLNSGSTWLDVHQLYVNPVNCLMYIPNREQEPCSLKLEIPENYTVASSMKETAKHYFELPDFHTLVDSPFIASDRLKHFKTDIKGIPFNFWFSGECKPVWKKMQKDVEAISNKQIETMGSFPTDCYHVLCHILPHHAYHGVEHTSSTVFTLGPSHELMEPSLYNEFLGLYSHELFHVWNVKTIRPADFLTYDYSTENYSELGYVYEGITTYYGDVFALRAGVFSWDFFCGIANDWLTKHYHNYGRKSYSVAQSSFDTWLDGYKPGVPNRKVSIYNEGALCALMIDLSIRHHSRQKYSLDDVIRQLDQEFGLLKKGYTRNDYKRILEQYAGMNLDSYFSSYLEGTEDYGKALIPLLTTVGLSVYTKENSSLAAKHYGLKTKSEHGKEIVVAIAPGSPAESAGIMLNDELRVINGINIATQFDEWLNYFNEEERLEITVSGAAGIRRVFLLRTNKTFYPSYVILKNEAATEAERQAFESWTGHTF